MHVAYKCHSGAQPHCTGTYVVYLFCFFKIIIIYYAQLIQKELLLLLEALVFLCIAVTELLAELLNHCMLLDHCFIFA